MSSSETKPAPSPAGGAVFLSYASQDAEAVRRIAAALRGAGVEVWFDQNELVGGDAWDAKIRGQIANCALFVPVISAATQARLEGYFRLEWKLAAQRTHTMADEKVFLLPVVIDDTRDAEAKVPAEFRAVQWTRLPGGETPEKFCARVKKLLESGTGVSPVSVPVDTEHGRDARATVRTKPSRPWLAPALAGVAALAAVAIWQPWRKSSPAPASVTPPVSAPEAAPVSDARKLALRAQSLIESLDGSRDDYRLAEELIAQAKAKDATDAEVCAAEAHIHLSYLQRGWDTSDQRRESARTAVQRAVRLDPASFEARFAQARLTSPTERDAEERERRLRDLRRERPADQRVLRALATVIDQQGRIDEAAAINRESAALPGGDPLALYNLSQSYWFAGRANEAETAIEASIAQNPFTGALLMNVWYKTSLRGDIVRARQLIERVSPAQMQEDRAAFFAYYTELLTRNPDNANRWLQALPRDWLNDFMWRGPKGLLVGNAHALAGRPEAARLEWQSALKLTEQRLVDSPKEAWLLRLRVLLLAKLGRSDEAARQFSILLQIRSLDAERATLVPPSITSCYVELGRTAEALRQIAGFVKNSPDWAVYYSSAVLRLDPAYDPLRGEPEFATIIAEVEARERAITAPASAPKADLTMTVPAKAAEKSVAVLAFRNLSDAQTGDYFSDGLSEELGNVLGRVPGLRVAGSTSAFSFKGKAVTLPEIARQLGVAYLVEGSVQREGSDVRITAKLINGADGLQLWTSGNLNREVKKVLAVQEEIAGLIAKELSLKLGVTSAAATVAVNPRAFELYLQGRRAWSLRTPAGFDRAEALFNQALEIEPTFARAHAALADVWLTRGQRLGAVGQFGQRASSEQARIVAKAREALKLDPNSAEAHATLGYAMWMEWNHPEAERTLRRAIALNPNYATARQWWGGLLDSKGHANEALAESRLAADLDPLSPVILYNHGSMLCSYGRYTEAITFLDRALALQPDSAGAIFWKANTLLRLGQTDAAVALIRRLPTDSETNRGYRIRVLGPAGLKAEAEALLPPADQAFGARRSSLLLALGRREEAIAGLDESVVASAFVGNLLFEPIFDSIRDHPKFKQLIATLGLTEAHARAQAWRAANPPEKAAK